MARLGPSLTEHRDSVVLHLVDLEKQARHGRVRGFFQIPKFPEEPQLCPVVTLVAYFNKVWIMFLRLLVTANLISRLLLYVETTTTFLCLTWHPSRV